MQGRAQAQQDWRKTPRAFPAFPKQGAGRAYRAKCRTVKRNPASHADERFEANGWPPGNYTPFVARASACGGPSDLGWRPQSGPASGTRQAEACPTNGLPFLYCFARIGANPPPGIKCNYLHPGECESSWPPRLPPPQNQVG